jgi:hypothetical protein
MIGQTYDILLQHNMLLIMFPPCQEDYKHEVPKVSNLLNRTIGTLVKHPISGERRICLTYRMTRPDYANNIPICACQNPTELRPVTKKQENIGKYFYICGTGKCGYFKWL